MLADKGRRRVRDLKEYTRAVDFGEKAHGLKSSDFRPCTLLGAIHIETGSCQRGAEWYRKAEERGASKDVIDHEIQLILSAAPADERAEIKKVLKRYDSLRYAHL